MRNTPRLVLASVAVAFLAIACGDDDAADDDATPETTAVDDAPTDTVDAGDATTSSTSTSSSSVPDAEAEEPAQESGGEEEGMGDPAVFVADLTGDGPASSATGRVEAESDLDGNLCFDAVAEGLPGEVVGAQVHAGGADDSGGVVLPVGSPTESSGDSHTWTDVCVPADDDLMGRLFSAPGDFYASVSTATLPEGAIRGQLELATIFDLTLS